MSFLPDINEDGSLQDAEVIPQLYVPKQRRFGLQLDSEVIRKDTKGTHFKDAPTMENMHECVPTEEHNCVTCGRELLV